MSMYEEKEGKTVRAKPDTWLEKRTINMIVRPQPLNVIKQSKHLIEEVTWENPETGHITEVKMTIDLIETPQKKVREYSIPISQRAVVKEEIDRLSKTGTIEPFDVLFASPAFLIEKKDGRIQMVVNYREFNKCTLKQSYLFPNIQEQLQNPEGEKIFSKIDLYQGYYQVEMDKKSKELTSFVVNG
ncbi:hypothetical protein PAEPH01_1582 [Pancytospora epiphaga]|nr:hypothetical protein PAEPH01_1582 [Pancytospora epiphaga]